MWIAFIFVSLNYQKHYPFIKRNGFNRCELLSFLYLWTIKSIRMMREQNAFQVVNCFHFCIFELSKAFSYVQSMEADTLWIAFIFVSLNYQKHFANWLKESTTRCELLSFLYLWTIKSIAQAYNVDYMLVVNCFHFCIFELSKALNQKEQLRYQQLWIAFIFVSLNYQKHWFAWTERGTARCELLSFLYLWTIKSISKNHRRYQTTLWIAFIFVSLNYQKHSFALIGNAVASCELLSFLYLWTIKSISMT